MTKLEQKIRESFEAWNAHDVDRLVSDSPTTPSMRTCPMRRRTTA